jgi:cysteinyl-tRNA synthetase
MAEIGPFHAFHPEASLPLEVWQKALLAAKAGRNSERQLPPADVLAMVEARQAARIQGDWPQADNLRRQVESMGWKILDTPDGPHIDKVT